MKNSRRSFYIVVLLIAAISLIASCAPLTTTKYGLTTRTVKTMDIYGAGIIHQPMLAEYEIEAEKVTGTATLKVKDVPFTKPLLDNLKQNAVADALKKAEADILIEPVFETRSEQEHSSREITVVTTVTGFPANYLAFRPITEDDLKILEGVLEAGRIQKVTTTDALDPEETEETAPNRDNAPILPILGGIIGVILLISIIF